MSPTTATASSTSQQHAGGAVEDAKHPGETSSLSSSAPTAVAGSPSQPSRPPSRRRPRPPPPQEPPPPPPSSSSPSPSRRKRLFGRRTPSGGAADADVAVAPLNDTQNGNDNNENGHDLLDEEELQVLSEEYAVRLNSAADVLLDRLFAYLSQLHEAEEEDDDNNGVNNNAPWDHNDDPLRSLPPRPRRPHHPTMQQGMTLPAAAISWLSGQFYPSAMVSNGIDNTKVGNNGLTAKDENNKTNNNDDDDDDNNNNKPKANLDVNKSFCSLVSAPAVAAVTIVEEDHPFYQQQQQQPQFGGFWMGNSIRERLSLLRFLLPRAKLIRMTRQVWPPELPSNKRDRSRGVFRRARGRPSRSAGSSSSPQNQPPAELNCSILSVNSGLTMDTAGGPVGIDGSSGQVHPSRREFLRYWHQLQHKPCVDMRVFPKTQVLVLDGVPPTWIVNLSAIQSTLQVLKVHKAAVYRLPRLLFPHPRPNKAQAAASYFYPHLTHVKLDYCGLGELSGLAVSLSRLENVQCLSLQHNEIREERTALKGLRGSSGSLVQLDLRHNLLASLPCAHWYLGGQLKVVKLSYNRMTTVRGLDCCYALEELWLDNNNFTSMTSLSGLAQLPDLKLVKIHSNPVTTLGSESYDPDCRLQLWTWFQEERRATTPRDLPALLDGHGLGLTATEREWELIRDEAFSTVVAVNSTPLSQQQQQQEAQNMVEARSVNSIADGAPGVTGSVGVSNLSEHFDYASTTPPSRGSSMHPVRNCRVTKKGRTRKARIETSVAYTGPKRLERKRSLRNGASAKSASKTTFTAMTPATIESHSISLPSPATLPKLSFSLQDVLETFRISEPGVQAAPAYVDDNQDESNVEFSDAQQELSDFFHGLLTGEPKTLVKPSSNPFDDAEDDDAAELINNHEPTGESDSGAAPIAADEVVEMDVREAAIATGEEEKNDHDDDDNNAKQLGSMSNFSAVSKLPCNGTVHTEDQIFPYPSRRGKAATVKLYPGANPRLFEDVFEANWDDLVARASQGLIPDGIPRTPVKEEQAKGNGPLFPNEATEMLANTTEPSTHIDGSIDASTISPSGTNSAAHKMTPTGASSSRIVPTVLEHVWQDDNSVLSSLGASRDNVLPRTNKFRMAEENSVYDGPETCRELNVTENLRLYFSTFVFPTSVPDVPKSVLEEMEEDEDDWQAVSLHHPRIQLWPEDRRWLERSSVAASSEIADWTANRERFVRLWEEQVVPCGKPGLRRLPPNRLNRLGFHGDKLFEGTEPDVYSECRNVLLCLSSKAFYIILQEDAVTARYNNQTKKRRFPLPIDRELLFRDAPWPHAVARHSLEDLLAVSIGFEFQRLTLRFRNPSIPKSGPFMYVLLTSNKTVSVDILQELQKLAKEATEGVSDLSSDTTTIAIENDSQLVIDRLSALTDASSIGTIRHYQVLHQRWKHGERGIVRRAFFATETRVLLVDEDYAADGHQLSDISIAGDKMADVQYRIVDEAELKQVSEVQAAGVDPRAITLIITPLSSLARTHRWRLICRDGEGAERLVDDVRKALESLKTAQPRTV